MEIEITSTAATAAEHKLESQTYSVAEAAQVLGVCNLTIYRLITRRILRPLPYLRHKRIPRRQVSAYLEGNLAPKGSGAM